LQVQTLKPFFNSGFARTNPETLLQLRVCKYKP